ncbi:hypothetical protein J5N97_016886 [Dioscorea zingiberensis]|uniref:DNA-directed RNA polymerase I subunit RPA12 n=1 Tax=Dioscorea zingiberensis TaxID=325984 RepID=A0A9D5CKD9_9LILI|nr:hypothetical protein J5N97_016886 [Dioscorea zingiberensis]
MNEEIYNVSVLSAGHSASKFQVSLPRLLLLAANPEGMAYSHGRDFLFCSLCGNLLSLDSPSFATCKVCGFKRNAEEILGREIRYTITAEDIIRELKIEPILSRETDPENEKVNRAVVNERCPQCNHPQLEYYTKQLRSADEGQTVFYECPSCFHKFSQNT